MMSKANAKGLMVNGNVWAVLSFDLCSAGVLDIFQQYSLLGYYDFDVTIYSYCSRERNC